MNLALFDFDGTISTCDTFTPFIKKVVPRAKLRLGYLLLLPSILAYRAGVLSGSAIRQQVVFFGLKGISKTHLDKLGKAHADTFLNRVIRPQALARIRWHLNSGDRVIVVLASLDSYLKPWCERLGVELICNELAAKGDILTGKYDGGDCSGSEKARRVQALVNLEDYSTVYAYGDTVEDNELLAIADEKYFQWQKIAA
ncbi:HAD family hydrolase [Psychrobacter ciconiae]|uniref:HAD family hydrolase n=1 Tax=Psychrobacter ciconiae TaxID=1553449 RepID=UPI0019187E70|nr:HAD family hydrolase [Psychrobacter ciconiae]